MTKEEYAISVKGAIDFLNGDYEQTLKALSDKMLKASESMEFEKAAEYRDLINSVKQVAQKQKITNADGEDKDIIALANDDTDAERDRGYGCFGAVAKRKARQAGEYKSAAEGHEGKAC